MVGVSIQFSLNGKRIHTTVPPTLSLLNFLRWEVGAHEVKNGCERGDCGACLVLLDGKLVNSCLLLAAQVDRTEIVTVKGIGNRSRLHPLQECFISHGAVQCGFCTPGMILAAKSLLDQDPDPTEDAIRRSLAGNFCRCTGYAKICRAISDAAKMMRAEIPVSKP